LALLERIEDMLPGDGGQLVRRYKHSITEIRLRTARPMRLALLDGQEIEGGKLSAQELQRIIAHLMDHSLYSRENELRHGYFTTVEGFRVGVCGKVNEGRSGVERLVNIGSICIRVPREIGGCAAEIVDRARSANRFGLLIVSPPGLGKTTFLRDYIRSLSDLGMNVGLADERREIACCLEGVPQLDVGCRTDVMDACPKEMALSMMIRACMPDLVAADEIGSTADARAILDARRCGIWLAATAHGSGLNDLASRENIACLLKEKVFDWCVLLGPKRGQVKQILPLHEGADEKVKDAQRFAAGIDTARLFLRGEDALQCAQAKM